MTNIEEIKDEPIAKTPTLNEDNYQQVPDRLVNDVGNKILKPLDVLVWMVFSHHQRKNKNSWPSNKTIAAILAVKERTVIRSINRLKAAKHLIRYGKTRYGTRFTTLTTRVLDNKIKQSLDIADTVNAKKSPPIKAPITNSQLEISSLKDSAPNSVPSARRFKTFDEYLASGVPDKNDLVMIEGDDIPF